MRGRVTTPSDLMAASRNASPGWVIHPDYPGEAFVLGQRVRLGNVRTGYRPATLLSCYAAVKEGVRDSIPDFVPSGIVVAVAASASGVILANEALRGRLRPHSLRGVSGIAYLSSPVRFGDEKTELRITPGFPPLSAAR